MTPAPLADHPPTATPPAAPVPRTVSREDPARALAVALRSLERAERHLDALQATQGPSPESSEARELVRQARLVLETSLTAPHGFATRAGRLELPLRAEAARLARSFAGTTTADWALPEATRAAVVDVVSELVTNGVRHARSRCLLVLAGDAQHVAVRVFDDGPGAPRLAPHRPGISEHGIGLHLVKRLSSRWGTSPAEPGKWVWAELDIPG